MLDLTVVWYHKQYQIQHPLSLTHVERTDLLIRERQTHVSVLFILVHTLNCLANMNVELCGVINDPACSKISVNLPLLCEPTHLLTESLVLPINEVEQAGRAVLHFLEHLFHLCAVAKTHERW